MCIRDRIWTGYKNTIIYTVVGTFINLVMTICAAYPLSRKDFVPRNFLMFIFMLTMYFSGGLIPTYLVVSKMHLLNTPWAMTVSYTHLDVYKRQRYSTPAESPLSGQHARRNWHTPPQRWQGVHPHSGKFLPPFPDKDSCGINTAFQNRDRCNLDVYKRQELDNSILL